MANDNIFIYESVTGEEPRVIFTVEPDLGNPDEARQQGPSERMQKLALAIFAVRNRLLVAHLDELPTLSLTPSSNLVLDSFAVYLSVGTHSSVLCAAAPSACWDLPGFIDLLADNTMRMIHWLLWGDDRRVLPCHCLAKAGLDKEGSMSAEREPEPFTYSEGASTDSWRFTSDPANRVISYERWGCLSGHETTVPGVATFRDQVVGYFCSECFMGWLVREFPMKKKI